MVEEGLAILFILKLITGEGGEKENRTLLPHCRLVELRRRFGFLRNRRINGLGRLEVHEKFKSHLNLQPSR